MIRLSLRRAMEVILLCWSKKEWLARLLYFLYITCYTTTCRPGTSFFFEETTWEKELINIRGQDKRKNVMFFAQKFATPIQILLLIGTTSEDFFDHLYACYCRSWLSTPDFHIWSPSTSLFPITLNPNPFSEARNGYYFHLR